MCVLVPIAWLGCGSSDEVAELFVHRQIPLHVLDHLDTIRVDGVARSLLEPREEPIETSRRNVLSVNFEDGSVGPLVPFGGLGVDPKKVPVRILRGSRAFGDGGSAELRGGVPHGVSLRTPPIPVRPTERYWLRYQSAGAEIGSAENRRPLETIREGEASLLLYRLTPGEATDPEKVLRDPERELAARVAPPREFWFPGLPDSHPWRASTTSFRTGPQATHMVVSFDLGRADDDRSPFFSQGVLRLDEIVIEAADEPVSSRYLALDGGLPDAGPLGVTAELGHPAHPSATERRYALAAPAPTGFRFRVAVPSEAALSFGTGLAPDAWSPGASPVEFTVRVTDASGATHEIHRQQMVPAARMTWNDVTLDLSPFAGQTVDLELATRTTRAELTPERQLMRLPESAALFSYPVLHQITSKRRLLILVVLDTVPAGRTSAYGYRRSTTPNLSRIAQAGTRFERALSPAPWTLPAVASLFTGLDPFHHRAGEALVGQREWRRPLAPGFTTVAERLRRAGFETRAWVNNPNLMARFGLQQGFSHYVDYQTGTRENAAEPGVEGLLGYLEETRGHDTFVVFHMMDPHGPYRPNAEFQDRFLSNRYEGPYLDVLNTHRFGELTTSEVTPDEADKRRIGEFHDAVVAYADFQLGRIFDAARESAGEQLAFLVTADHGEEFWEHDHFEHGQSLYDDQLRVPLVLVAPGYEPGTVLPEPVSTRAVAATLLTQAGVDVPRDSLGPALPKPGESGRASPKGILAASTLYGVQRMSLEQAGLKYIYNQTHNGIPAPRAPRPATRHELYRIADDPGEERNLFEELREAGVALHEQLAARYAPALGGDYVVFYQAGEATIPTGGLEASLTLPLGGHWRTYAKELLWPAAPESIARLQVDRDWSFARSRVRLRLEAPRGLVGLTPVGETGSVTVAFELAGRPFPPERIHLGASDTPAPPEFPMVLNDESLWLEPSELLRPLPGSGPRLRFGRVRPIADMRGSSDAPISDALRERLEALGYADRS